MYIFLFFHNGNENIPNIVLSIEPIFGTLIGCINNSQTLLWHGFLAPKNLAKPVFLCSNHLINDDLPLPGNLVQLLDVVLIDWKVFYGMVVVGVTK